MQMVPWLEMIHRPGEAAVTGDHTAAVHTVIGYMIQTGRYFVSNKTATCIIRVRLGSRKSLALSSMRIGSMWVEYRCSSKSIYHNMDVLWLEILLIDPRTSIWGQIPMFDGEIWPI